jgi:cobalt-precorrin 5A hydrolase
MIVAGIGCRRDCPAEDIVVLVRRAEALSHPIDALAAPAFKADEPGLREAAACLGLPLLFVPDAILVAAQPHCPTRSEAAGRARGLASVAEAAAIGAGGTLLLPRIASARATCAVASRP